METDNNQPGGINYNTWGTMDEHLSLPVLPFAILLKGPWGVGKTWFIRDFMEKNKEKYRSCYVSLFGATSSSDIKTAVGFGMLKSTGKLGKGAAWVTKCFSDLDVALPMVKSSSSLASFFMSRAPAALLKDVFKKFSKESKTNVFIFDDLDRCNLDIKDILGYINDFVVDEQSRVIIVMHEKQVKKEQAGYLEFKEKVIGLTLSIEPDHIATLEDAVNNILSKKPEIKKVIDENKKSICEIFIESKTNNLRHLGRAIVELTRILDSFEEPMLRNKEFVENVIKFHCVYSFAIHSGEVEPNDFKCSDGSYAWGNHSDKLKPLLERHPWIVQLKIGAVIFWQIFFTSGVITDELKIYYYNVYVPKESHGSTSSAPIRLWYFRNMEDVDFDNDLAELNLQLKEKKYKSADIVLLAFSMKLLLSEKKLIDDDSSNILNDALEYIKVNSLEFSREYDDFKSVINAGYVQAVKLQNNDDSMMQKIKTAMIDKCLEDTISKTRERILGDLQKTLQDNPEDFFIGMKSFSKERYMSFKYISDTVSAKEVVDALYTLPEKKRNEYFYNLKEIIEDSLREFHNDKGINDYESIMNWTDDLSTELENQAQNTPLKLRKYNANEMATNVRKIADYAKIYLADLKKKQAKN